MDKGALFNAMMERATLPLEAAVKLLDERAAGDPLQCLRDELMTVLRITVEDPKARRVFEIAMLKVEFTDEVDAVRVRRRESMTQWQERMEGYLNLALAMGLLRPGVDPRNAAMGFWTMIDGLIRNWVFEPSTYDLMELGGQVLDTYLAGLRAR
ncbi:TetR family transcriptional regulator C-terminal domain-containing protein [Massilia niastensis]|uniref:TetR family transcriptional regulator C-terminal domain-containing protein n=1 Tax=Massilia niastensis TaxID=544911 RepID=UPI00036A207C